ncbi:hypothetical protein [Kitasatospora sp. NPDC088548]|uniref:hypothetical protein n=1 Tax=Kitasatospora sp. NPDC088548 TaxID=3364075 RepID=UPI0038141469
MSAAVPAATTAAPAPPRPRTAAVVALGSLVTVLDATIVDVALNRPAEGFQAPRPPFTTPAGGRGGGLTPPGTDTPETTGPGPLPSAKWQQIRTS